MSRERLFKAKRKKWKELPKDKWWVEGNLLKLETDCFTDTNDSGYMYYIIPKRTNGSWSKQKFVLKFISPCYEVDPSTLCQYTGLTDKNGKEIWENDIIRIHFNGAVIVDVVKYDPPMFSPSRSIRWSMNEDEVIGNVFDNPELLEQEG